MGSGNQNGVLYLPPRVSRLGFWSWLKVSERDHSAPFLSVVPSFATCTVALPLQERSLSPSSWNLGCPGIGLGQQNAADVLMCLFQA